MESVSNWSVQDVINFLHNIGITDYDTNFTRNHINGQTLLQLKNEEMKNDLDIRSLGHRKQILSNIDKLRPDSNDSRGDMNEYAMTACISAALSSILSQHNKDKLVQSNDRNNIIRMAVSMAAEAAQYIIHNQKYIINTINTDPNTNTNTNPKKEDDIESLKSIQCNNEAKRSNRTWSDFDERELIKLKSLASLTWNGIGEYLQRTGAACQLHWKQMKIMHTIQGHIEYIKLHCADDNGNDNGKNDMTEGIAKVLKTSEWKLKMLDSLYNQSKKEKHKLKKKHKHHRHKKKNSKKKRQKYLTHEKDKERANANARWTKDEEDILVQMMAQSDQSMLDISTKLGRSIPAINQHRLAMKHKHAQSLNESSDNCDNGKSSEEECEDSLSSSHYGNVVLTPIITPNSYVSNIEGIPSYIHSYGDNANVSSNTTSSVSTSGNSNPFQCMPVFNVHHKRSLSPPNQLNGNVFLPPNKKARLSSELLDSNIALPCLNTSFQS